MDGGMERGSLYLGPLLLAYLAYQPTSLLSIPEMPGASPRAPSAPRSFSKLLQPFAFLDVEPAASLAAARPEAASR